MNYVYLLKSRKDDNLYIGCTDNLKRRLKEHSDGLCKATKFRRPLALVYYEAYKDMEDAKRREWQLKRHSQAVVELKKRLISSLSDEEASS